MIGGAVLIGGAGTAIGALVGAALIEVIRNSLGLLGINPFWQGTVIGACDPHQLWHSSAFANCSAKD